MAKLTCSNYGFECEYVAQGESEQVVDDFKKHMLDEHGIDYSKETVMQFVNRENEYP